MSVVFFSEQLNTSQLFSNPFPVKGCTYMHLFINMTIINKVIRGYGWWSHIMPIQCEKSNQYKKCQNIVE